nr:MAG TPA: hypothetical protein [Caudoviricetes sp.]
MTIQVKKDRRAYVLQLVFCSIYIHLYVNNFSRHSVISTLICSPDRRAYVRM